MRYVDKNVSVFPEIPTAPLPVAGVFVLERGERRTEQLDQRAALSCALSYVRAPEVFKALRRDLQLHACAELAGRPTVLIRYEAGDGGSARIADEIEGWVG